MHSTEFSNEQNAKIYDVNMKFHYWNVYRNKYILDFILENNLDNFLDIGSGRGIVTDYLHKNNLKIQGVELSDTTPLTDNKVEIKYKTNALDLNSDLDIESISLYDVIEHIEDPVFFLNQLIDKFTHLKHILITVPSRQELWSNFDDFNGHFKRYHLSELQLDFKNCKAEIIKSSYFFHILYYLIWINNKVLKQDRDVDYSRIKPMGKFEKLIHKSFALFFKIESIFFTKKQRGSSIIFLLKVNK